MHRLFRAGLSVVAVSLVASAALGQSLWDKYRPVTEAMIQKPDAGEWLNWRRTLDLQGHSPLVQINRNTVSRLELAWAAPMPSPGLNEIAPLVHDGVMFIASNNNIVQAYNAASGDLLWTYTHKVPEIKGGYHSNQARRQKNSITLYKDRVILTTVDSKLISLDAKSGKPVWTKQVLAWEKGYSYTAGPFVAEGKIITGTSGCSITGTAGGCYILAHDADTGEELWRVNTLADPTRPEVEASWKGVPVENRWGATPWTTGSYDSDLDLTYWGTGMPIPYNEIIRGTKDGDVLYTNSTLAIDARTGKIVWYFQHLPRDNWDLDHPFERVLVDSMVNGKMTKMLVSIPGKTGIAYGLDRTTGKFLWSQETVYQNAVSKIDPTTGRATPNEKIIPTQIGQEVLFCPAISGGKLWMAVAYSPQTNLLFAPLNETCQTLKPRTQDFLPGEAVGGIQSGPRTLAPGKDRAGAVFALDVATGKIKWTYRQRATISSSILSTAGGLMFVGDSARYFMALDQKTGDVLWKTRLNAPIGGYPMSYEVNGVQYIAVPTGDNTHANAASLFPEIPYVSGSNSVYVFKVRGAK